MSDKPPEVRRAILLLWAGFAVTGLRVAADWSLSAQVFEDFFAASVFAITFVALAFFIWKISQGKNWARLTLLVLYLIGLPFSLYSLPGDFGRSLLVGLCSTAQIALQGAGLLLISRGAAKDWFTQGYTEPPLPSLTG